jgi:hypothetical protein
LSVSFFQNLFKPATPAKPALPAAPKVAPVSVPPVPQHLPNITAPTAAHIAQTSNPSPVAQQILAANPHQTPSQYLSALQEKHQGGDMVHTLSHGMSDHDGVHWASQSADKVSDKLPPHEVNAMKAAQAWAKNPTPENQLAAAKAAAQGGCRGPGSMAAQGAAWAQPGSPAGAATTAVPRLTPHAVSGSVLMSSAVKANPALTVPTMTAPTVAAPALAAPALHAPLLAAQIPQLPQAPAVVPPEVQAQTFQQQHPFIAMGLKIASGKSA